MMDDLQRFLTAQDGKSIHGNTLYEQALIEIQEGKLGFECWIRYVYPQLKRSGTSPTTEFYGLKNRAEAEEYLMNPVLKERLIAAAQVLLDNEKPLNTIFSNWVE